MNRGDQAEVERTIGRLLRAVEAYGLAVGQAARDGSRDYEEITGPYRNVQEHLAHLADVVGVSFEAALDYAAFPDERASA